MKERVSSKAGPVRGGCEGCPSAGGGCASCPLRRSISIEKSVFVGKTAVLKLKEPILSEGFYILSPSFARGSEPQIRTNKETTCSICGESSVTCPHRKIYNN